MKCESCLQLLEEYIDGELRESEVEPVRAHLVTCATCASEFESLTAEQEIYARYDRDLTISPALWNEIAARTVNTAPVVKTEAEPGGSWRKWFAVPSLGWSFAGAMAILIAVIALAVIYFQPSKPRPEQAKQGNEVKTVPTDPEIKPDNKPETPLPASQVAIHKPRPSVHTAPVSKAPSSPDKTVAADQSDVLFSDVAYSVAEERETQVHIENAQNLLRSVRNIEISEDDTDIDVTYEKALSRRLLSENVILRREAEMSGKFPTKTLLSDLEPFLIDIANLPDKPAPEDLRLLKQRVQKTEIVAALQSGY